MQTHCVFEYRYRDASNFKKHASLLLTGANELQSSKDVRASCEFGQLFVPEQIGIPPLYEELWELSGGPTADDHAFHEFVELRKATDDEIRELPVWGTLDQLLQAFRAVKEWDVLLSPNCGSWL